MDLKRAAAGGARAGCYPLVESVNLVVRRSFSGALSCSEGQGAAETTAKFLGFTLSNVLLPARRLCGGRRRHRRRRFPLLSQSLVLLAAASRAARAAVNAGLLGITCEGVSILAPPEDRKLVPIELVMTCLALTGLFVLLCALLGVWTWTNRKSMIVLIASPPLLAQILVGAVLMSLATVPLLMQDDGLLPPLEADGAHIGLDAACAVAPLTYSVCFALMYSSLWLKTWRLDKIFNNPKLKKVYITSRRMQAYSAGFLLVVPCATRCGSPTPRCTRSASRPPSWAAARCSRASDTAPARASESASPLVAVILVALLYGLRLVFYSRSIPKEFGEGDYITMSLITSFEAIVVGVPLLAIDTNPSARLIIVLAIIIRTAARARRCARRAMKGDSRSARRACAATSSSMPAPMHRRAASARSRPDTALRCAMSASTRASSCASWQRAKHSRALVSWGRGASSSALLARSMPCRRHSSAVSRVASEAILGR